MDWATGSRVTTWSWQEVIGSG
ncbi:MAG: hypothetical protein CISAcid_15670 [uncultured Acidilobus sp. CIS]|jgi:hypothetical protein|nr:MAG: hypothetical protein CISAcid_15670 [uncultured Acidilobus sp. CIS]